MADAMEEADVSILAAYATPHQLPASEAAGIGRILGLETEQPMTDVALAAETGKGLCRHRPTDWPRCVGRAS